MNSIDDDGEVQKTSCVYRRNLSVVHLDAGM